MITLDKDEKKMVIPSALGNFGNGSGGSGVTRQEVYEIVDSSLTIYDEGIQQEIGAVSAATSELAADIQVVSGSVEGINEELSGITADIAELSGITSGIGEDITLLQTTVGNHTNDIAELSASTVIISADTKTNADNIGELSGITSAISETITSVTQDVSNLSAATEVIAGSFSAYTPTSGFSTINGSAITAGGNIVIEAGGGDIEIFDLLDYGTGFDEMARLFTDLNNARLQGKQAALLSAFYGDPVARFAVVGFFDAGANSFNFQGIGKTNLNGDFVASTGVWIKANNFGNLQVYDGHYYFKKMLSTGAPYTLPKASASTLGGVKIGSGITIDSGGTISVSGGSGGGDYQVVTELPATAEEGQMFYVPEHTISYSGITLDRNSVEENYIGNINGVVDAPAVYYSNGSFFWGWENDGALHYDSNGFYYQTDGTNGTFLVVPTIDGVSVTPSNGATTAATPDAASVDVPGTTYIYKDGGFEVVEYSKKQYFINSMTTAQRAALWTEIVTLTNSGQTNLTQVLADYQFFIQAALDGQVWGEAYFLNFERDLVWIGGVRPSKASYPFKMVRNVVGINANGTIESNIQDELENPQIKPYGFSYPDNGKLRYDADNSKFVMTNWYDTGNTRDVDTTGCTAGIASSTHLDEFINNGLRNEAADRYYVCTPQYEFSFIESGVAHSYTRPTIIGQDIATITVDGRSFSRKYTFIYLREDGTRQGLSFVADSNGYAANFTFVGPFM